MKNSNSLINNTLISDMKQNKTEAPTPDLEVTTEINHDGISKNILKIWINLALIFVQILAQDSSANKTISNDTLIDDTDKTKIQQPDIGDPTEIDSKSMSGNKHLFIYLFIRIKLDIAIIFIKIVAIDIGNKPETGDETKIQQPDIGDPKGINSKSMSGNNRLLNFLE